MPLLPRVLTSSSMYETYIIHKHHKKKKKKLQLWNKMRIFWQIQSMGFVSKLCLTMLLNKKINNTGL